MANIYPEDFSFYTITGSEELLLDKMKQQLGEEYHIFYSIRWNDSDEDSECDFLIFHEKLGFICMEVKGGRRIGVQNGTYFIELDEGDRRFLKCSPHSQAEKSMRYFLRKYNETFNKAYDGIYGYAAAFPFYHFSPVSYDDNATLETTINVSDLNNLKKKILNIFMFYKKKSDNERKISVDDNISFLSIINKSISIDYIKGGHNLLLRKQIEELTRSQNVLLDFINSYEKVIITGGAGTGKSYLAYTKAKRSNDKKILFATCSESLIQKARSNIEQDIIKENYSGISYITFRQADDFNEKVDLLIIDEGQEINEEALEHLSKLTTKIYFFADYYQQRVVGVDMERVKKSLKIDHPSFQLSRNVRSTANIIEFLKLSFDDIPLYYKNHIEGSRPEKISIDTVNSFKKYLSNLIRDLVFKSKVESDSIVVLIDQDITSSYFNLVNGILKELSLDEMIIVQALDSFKGHDSDVIVYINTTPESQYENYLAYTRARVLLYEVEFQM
jgi:hypothetical protein